MQAAWPNIVQEETMRSHPTEEPRDEKYIRITKAMMILVERNKCLRTSCRKNSTRKQEKKDTEEKNRIELRSIKLKAPQNKAGLSSEKQHIISHTDEGKKHE